MIDSAVGVLTPCVCFLFRVFCLVLFLSSFLELNRTPTSGGVSRRCVQKGIPRDDRELQCATTDGYRNAIRAHTHICT